MGKKVLKVLSVLFLYIFLTINYANAFIVAVTPNSGCPSVPDTLSLVNKIFYYDKPVLRAIYPNPYIASLCDVVLQFGVNGQIVHIAKNGNYLLYGSIANNHHIIIQNTTVKLSQIYIDKNIIDSLNPLVDVVYNADARRVLYAIIDLNTEYTWENIRAIETWADEHNVQIRIIFFSQKKYEVNNKALYVLCSDTNSNSGIETLNKVLESPKFNNFKSCADGETKLKNNTKVLMKMNIYNSPTFISDTGHIYTSNLYNPWLKNTNVAVLNSLMH